MISSWGKPERAAHRVTTEFVIAQSRICHKPTARTATVSVATYAWTKLYTQVTSWISDVYKFMHGPYLKWLQPPLWLKFVSTVCGRGEPAIDDL